MERKKGLVAILVIVSLLAPSISSGGIRESVERSVNKFYQDGPPEIDVTVAVEDIADDYGSDVFWILIGGSIDLYSTTATLRWCKKCREGNILGWDAEARLSLKLGTVAIGSAGCWKLRRSGHKKMATIIRWTVFGIQAAAAANNVVLIIKE